VLEKVSFKVPRIQRLFSDFIYFILAGRHDDENSVDLTIPTLTSDSEIENDEIRN